MAKRTKPSKSSAGDELFNLEEYGNFFVPSHIVKFLIHLADLKTNEKIIGIGLNPSDFSQAIGKDLDYRIISANEIQKPGSKELDEKFDVILCAPIFGFSSKETGDPNEEAWVRWGIEHLTDQGRLLIIVPMGVLSNYSQQSIRQFIIEKSNLKAILEFPSDWALDTSTQASLLIISSKTAPEFPVKMFKFEQRISWEKLLKINFEESLIELSTKLADGNVFEIPYSKLESNRLDIKYYDPAYQIDVPDYEHREVKLAELVTIRSGERFTDKDMAPTGVPFVQVKNIGSDGKLDLNDVRTINPNLADESRRSYCQPHDILVSIAGTVGKAALVPPFINVSIDTSIRRLTVIDKSEVFPEYLAYYIRSKTVQLQLERLISGSVIKVLSSPNLEQIIVYLPSYEKQREIVDTYNKINKQRENELLTLFPDSKKMQRVLFERAPAVKDEKPTISLSQIIQTGFPYPISRAFTVLERNKDKPFSVRISKLIQLSESIVYYIYSILAADHLSRFNIDDSEAVRLLNGSLNNYSLDYRIRYISRILKVASNDKAIDLFVPELTDCNFGICSEIHNNLRNVIGHQGKTDEWCKHQFPIYEPKLNKLLESLIWLKNYRLIQITKLTIRDKKYIHDIVTMSGNNALFPTQPEELEAPLEVDTEHVILLNENNNALNLHPFYFFHAWKDTGFKNHLCFMKQINIDSQKIKYESLEEAGEISIDVDTYTQNLISDVSK